MFNLKNPDCKMKFKEVTNNSQKLRQCFVPTLSFPDQCNRFFKSLDDIIHQCFKKVRIGTKSGFSKEIEQLFCEKSKIKMFLAGNICKFEETKAREKLEKISNLTSARNVKIVKDHIQNLGKV